MKNVIFLDIDGVLNDNDCNFLQESVDVLKQLILKHNAQVVIISSMQMSGTENRRKKIRYRFDKLGIHDIDFINPNFEGDLCDIKLPSRLLGIVDYLIKHQVSNYVILDDEFHNDYKLICLNYYRTLSFKGLTYKDLAKITFKQVNLNNFKYINYQYRELGAYELATNNLIKVLKKKYEIDTKLIDNKNNY